MLDILHTQPDTFAAHINFDDTNTDVLVKTDDLCGVGDETVGELGDVDKTVLMNTDVNEDTEVGDVRYDTREFHSYDEVVEGVDILVEFKNINLSTWVTARLLKFGEDVVEGGLTPPPSPSEREFHFCFHKMKACYYSHFSANYIQHSPSLKERGG